MTTASSASPDILIGALRLSHDRLSAAVGSLADTAVTDRSYCTDWSIAQVLSHLGSGAEIFMMFVDAGCTGAAAPGLEQMQPIWDRWNAMTALDQVSGALSADAAFLDRLDALDASQRAQWRMSLFGSDQSLTDILLLRLGEHALHTWDVVVALDPAATLEAGAAELLVDTLPAMVPRYGKPVDRAVRALVTTKHPERSFVLAADDAGARIAPSDPAEPVDSLAAVSLPAEALIRLTAGRLDSGHMASVETADLDLDDLRRVFPGV